MYGAFITPDAVVLLLEYMDGGSLKDMISGAATHVTLSLSNECIR